MYVPRVRELPSDFGAYTLLERLGSGAMSEVFLARPHDSKLPSPIVIKLLHVELIDNSIQIHRFLHEAEIATTFNSAHVAKVYDVGCIGEIFFMAMEYIDGWPLGRLHKELIKLQRRLRVETVIELISGVLRGLNAIHSAQDEDGTNLGIVHRDLSPNNVMLGEDGLTRLIDLGLGRSRLREDWKTRTGTVMGTPGYMAPEQARGQKVDARADVYTAGILLWESLAGQRYVEPGGIMEYLWRTTHAEFRPLKVYNPDVSPELEAVARKALERARNDRYDSAAAMLKDLERCRHKAKNDAVMKSILSELMPASLQERRQEIARILSSSIPVSQASLPPSSSVSAKHSDTLPPTQIPATHISKAPPEAPPWPAAPGPSSNTLLKPFLYVTGALLLFGAGVAFQSFRTPVPVTPVAPIEITPAAPGAKGTKRPKEPVLTGRTPAKPVEDETPVEPKVQKPSKPKPRIKSKPQVARARPAAGYATRLAKLKRRVTALMKKYPASSAEREPVEALSLDVATQSKTDTPANVKKLEKLEARISKLERK